MTEETLKKVIELAAYRKELTAIHEINDTRYKFYAVSFDCPNRKGHFLSHKFREELEGFIADELHKTEEELRSL